MDENSIAKIKHEVLLFDEIIKIVSEKTGENDMNQKQYEMLLDISFAIYDKLGGKI